MNQYLEKEVVHSLQEDTITEMSRVRKDCECVCLTRLSRTRVVDHYCTYIVVKSLRTPFSDDRVAVVCNHLQ